MKPHIYRWDGRWLVRWDPDSEPELITAACWWALDRKES